MAAGSVIFAACLTCMCVNPVQVIQDRTTFLPPLGVLVRKMLYISDMRGRARRYGSDSAQFFPGRKPLERLIIFSIDRAALVIDGEGEKAFLQPIR